MQEYYQNFFKTLVLNIATISAIIVGVVSFAVRSFNENQGSEKVRGFILTVLNKIEYISAYIKGQIVPLRLPQQYNDVPDVEVAQ